VSHSTTTITVEVAGHRHPGKELGGRDLFRRDSQLRGGLTLRHPHGVVDKAGRVDLHGDRGFGSVHPVEVQHGLEIEVHPLDAPAERVQGERFVGREAGGGQHIGQQLIASAASAPPEVAQQLRWGRDAGAGAHQPVFQHPVGMAALAQALELVQAQLAVAPDHTPALLAVQRFEKVAVPYKRSPSTRVSRARSGQTPRDTGPG
jgi:hypothetical protein